MAVMMVISFAAGWLSEIVVSGVNAATVLQSFTILVTVSLAVWTYRATKRKEAEARLFEQKAAAYLPLVETFKKVQMGGKFGLAPIDQDELTRTMVDVKFKAIIWGSQSFIQTLSDFSDDSPTSDNEIAFDRMARLCEEMRRELGHHDRKGVGYDVVESLIVAQDRHLIRAKKARYLASLQAGTK
jgi:hypothetical protein